jgi:hypothetical protein
MSAVVPQGLAVEVLPALDSMSATLEVIVKAGPLSHQFLAGWAGDGWPGDVDRLLLGAPKVQVVFARRFSQGAMAKLADRRIGWVDEAGQANIIIRSGLVIVREPLLPETSEGDTDHWTQTMLSAAEAILAGTPPTVEAVEAVTGMSRGAAANAMARFEQRGRLIRPGPKRGRGVARQIVDVDAFIDDYAQAAKGFRAQQKSMRLHRLMADPVHVVTMDIGPNLNAVGATWAVTGAAASTLLAPYLTDVTVLEIYVDAAHFNKSLAGVLDARDVPRGHLIEVWELPTPISAKGPWIDGVQLALPARVYADLVAAGGRYEEAAHHLREVRGVGPGSK